MRLIAPILLLSALLAQSATYRVSTNGSDSANGTTAPWLTIQHAADTMTAGDTCIVSNGVYLERVTTGAHGTPASRITFAAESTNAVVNSFTITKSNTTVQGFTIIGKDYGIEGSLWVKAGGHNARSISNVFASSAVGTPQLYIDGSTDRTLSGAWVEACRFLNGFGHGAVVSGGNNVFTNCFFEATNGNDAFRIVGTNTVISGCVFTNWSNVHLTGGSIRTNALYYFVTLGTGMNWTNTGARKFYAIGVANKFTATGTTPTSWGTYSGTYGQAILARADNAYLYPSNATLTVGTNYYFHSIYNGEWGLWDNFTNVQSVATRATGISNQWTAIGTTPTAWGYAVVGYGTNTILTNGTLEIGKEYFFVESGGDADFDNVGAASIHQYQIGEAYYFKATNSPPVEWGSGTILENANHPDIMQSFCDGSVGTIPPDYPKNDLLFERNLVIDCTNAVQIGNITDDGNFRYIRNWTFRNNIYNNIDRTMNLFAPDFAFYNNTFYRAGAGSGASIIAGASSAGTASNLTILNNLFVECDILNRASTGWYGSDAENLFADFNLVVGAAPDLVKTGFTETHGINGSDPLFVDAANGDFRLLTNSPAIGAGTNLTALGVTTDYTGATRTNWTIGALEGTGEAPPAGPSQTASVTFAPVDGTTFTNSVLVTLSCATAGASIWWTASGTATTNSTAYTGPLTLTNSVTISAIAAASNYTASAVTSATFTRYEAPEPEPQPSAGVFSVDSLSLQRIIRR